MQTRRFKVQSSDVISELRVDVLEENGSVSWFKERFLSDDEIVDHIIYSPSSTLCWSIHRPKRGWYINIKSPTTKTSIPLIPIPLSSPYYTDAALSVTPPTSTEYILTPHSNARVPTTPEASLLSRTFAFFKNHQPSHSRSFTLSPLPGPLHPLVTFHDRTPVFTVSSLAGDLEIDSAAENASGMPTSFWIAVALTYLAFLEDRESYLAALHD